MRNVDVLHDKSKFLEVSELGSRYNLSFSSQLVLRNRIIAVDGVKKTLLMLETGKGTDQPLLIDLNKVRTVAVRKSYGTIKHGELKNKGIEEFLDTIELQFHLRDKSGTIDLPVYNREIDDKADRKRLDKNAKNWQRMLSKMIGKK